MRALKGILEAGEPIKNILKSKSAQSLTGGKFFALIGRTGFSLSERNNIAQSLYIPLRIGFVI